MVYKEGIDQWLLAVTSDPAAKGSTKDLEVAGAGPVRSYFTLSSLLSFPCVAPNVVFQVLNACINYYYKPNKLLASNLKISILTTRSTCAD